MCGVGSYPGDHLVLKDSRLCVFGGDILTFGYSTLDPFLTDRCVDVVDLEEDVAAAVEWAGEMVLTLVANVNLTDIVAAIDRKSLTFSVGFWLFFTIKNAF